MQRAVVPALCAGNHSHPQWISLNVCRGACGCADLSGRGLPELQQTAAKPLTKAQRAVGRLGHAQWILPGVCRGAGGCADLSGRGLPELQQRTAGATAGDCWSYGRHTLGKSPEPPDFADLRLPPSATSTLKLPPSLFPVVTRRNSGVGSGPTHPRRRAPARAKYSARARRGWLRLRKAPARPSNPAGIAQF